MLRPEPLRDDALVKDVAFVGLNHEEDLGVVIVHGAPSRGEGVRGAFQRAVQRQDALQLSLVVEIDIFIFF